MENIIRNEKNGVPYLTFPSFERLGIMHACSTKSGGVSKGACASMNMSFSRGDVQEDVLANHRLFAQAVGYNPEHLVLSDQIHETVIRRVDKTDCGKGVIRQSDLVGVDGLITNDKQVVLMIFFADCVPLFFYDPVRQAIGASHSGWRGTVMRMGARTVEAMQRKFESAPEDIYAVIGPSICQDCYEVSEDVIEAFRKEFPREQWGTLWEEKENHKYQLNLREANRILLEEAGIPREQIEVSGYCTCCHADVLFSHRVTNGRRGNLSGIISLERKM